MTDVIDVDIAECPFVVEIEEAPPIAVAIDVIEFCPGDGSGAGGGVSPTYYFLGF